MAALVPEIMGEIVDLWLNVLSTFYANLMEEICFGL
jgi:hypothetical protein